MRRPNFFLAGAPKCGSTALYEYLRQHPDVFLPRVKEPRFFATDLGDFREIQNLTDYEKLYVQAPESARVVGDCSPWYLCSEAALDGLREYSPDARIAVILRNPLDMLPALHAQFLLSFKEDVEEIEAAWDLQDERAAGRSLPPSPPAAKLLQYGRITSFGEQCASLLERFPREQVHFILFDDFVNDTRRTYVELLRFLGLPDDGRTDFPAVNERKRHRNPGVAWLFHSPASPFRRLIGGLRQATGLRSTGVLARFLRMNQTARERTTLDPVFRARLADYYREDVRRLGDLLGRDLSHWLADRR